MTERELEILQIIKDDPLISQYELAYLLGITRSGVAAHIHNLTRKGYIKGRGYVLNEPTFVSVIGGINMDIMGIPKEKLIEQNSNPGKISYSLGGAGRNIALTLTKLDVPNYLISVYGNDMNGEEFVNNAKEQNMDIQCCEKIQGQHTSTFMYIDDSNGNKKMGIDDMEIYTHMTPLFIEKYLEKINHSQYCILDTNLPKETIDFLYKNVTIPIIIKTVSINKNDRLISPNQQIDILVTTPTELIELISAYNQTYVDMKSATSFLLTKNIQHIIVFSVQEGLYFHSQDGSDHIKKERIDSKNTNGASAVLTATLVWALQNKFLWEQVLKYAYTAAVETIATHDSVPPLLSLTQLIESEKELFHTHPS